MEEKYEMRQKENGSGSEKGTAAEGRSKRIQR
jgi:hypothetical protein